MHVLLLLDLFVDLRDLDEVVVDLGFGGFFNVFFLLVDFGFLLLDVIEATTTVLLEDQNGL